MRALVTGGGGFLGGAIVQQLLDAGWEPLSFSRSRHEGLHALGVAQQQGDLADPAAVAAAAEGCDAVFHVAARVGSWGRRADYWRTNVEGTENVIAACRANGIGRLVHTSSPAVAFQRRPEASLDESAPYPDRYDAHYPATKAEAERRVLAANDADLRTVALRPHLVWGPGDTSLLPRILSRARAGRLRRIATDPPAMVDPTYIDDAARAHVLAAERLGTGDGVPSPAGRAYFISGGEPISLWDMIDRLLAAAGLPPVERSVSVGTALTAAVVMEAIWTLLRLQSEPPMTRWTVRQLSTTHCLDISAARRDLGWAPQVPIDQGLERLSAALEDATGGTE